MVAATTDLKFILTRLPQKIKVVSTVKKLSSVNSPVLWSVVSIIKSNVFFEILKL